MSWVPNSRGDGLINTATATAAEPVKGRRDIFALKNERGVELGLAHESDLRSPATVIAGPLAACFINPDDGSVEWRAIVAWNVSRNGAEAIIAGTRPAGAMHIEFADGSLLGVDCGRRFADLEAAVDAVVSAAAADQEEAA